MRHIHRTMRTYEGATMARANATMGDVRAIAWRDLARSITQPINEGARARTLAIEPWLRYIVPVVALLFLALLALAAVSHIRSERHRALSAAAREVDLRASTLAMTLNQAVAAAPDRNPGDLLRDVLAATPELRAGEIMLAEPGGTLARSEPAAGDPAPTLNAWL